MVFEGGNVSCLTYQCFHAECGMCVFVLIMKKRNDFTHFASCDLEYIRVFYVYDDVKCMKCAW